MNKHMIFSFSRFLAMFRKDFMESIKGISLAIGIYLGVYLLIFVIRVILNDSNNVDSEFSKEFFSSFLLIAGSIYGSLAFSNLHNSQKRAIYLLLPASHLEKFLSAFLITSIFFLMGWLFIFWPISYLVYYISKFLFLTPFPPLHPFDREVFGTILTFYFIHSIFFTGSVFFKGFSYFKTVLGLMAISLMMMILLSLSAVIVVWISTGQFTYSIQVNELVGNFKKHNVVNFLQVMTLLIIPPWLWIASYVRLTEKQVLS